MDDQRKFLVKILEIVDKEDDKEEFADMFIGFIFEDSLYNLIQTLPEAKRDKVAKKLDANLKNPAAVTSLFKHYFSQAQIVKITEETSKKAIMDYLQSVDSLLSQDQRKKLERLSEEFSMPKPPHISKPLTPRSKKMN